MARHLPERFDATPLRSSESGFARRSTDFRNPETDAEADRSYGLVIEHALKVARITPKEVAHALDMDESNIHQWFAGKSRPPLGRLRSKFARFDRAYVDTIVATSDHLESSTTYSDRRRA